MKKRFVAILLVTIFVLSVFAGCGTSKSKDSTVNYADTAGQAVGKVSYNSGYSVKAPEETIAASTNETPNRGEQTENVGAADSFGGGGDISQNISNAILSERKVIRSANVTVEVEKFDEAYAKLETTILGIGFIQSTNINSEKYYQDDKLKLLRSGTIIIRVDREKFDKVLNSIKEIGEVLSWNINGEDVTDKFFDTESRLRLLRIEESKLEEYLKKLSDLDQIFKTESRLTDIRYQIEALTGNLKKISDLVELSTIAININEKRPDSDTPVKPKNYGQKLLDNFLDSMKGVTNFVGDLLIALVAAIPVLILIGLFVLIAFLIYRKIPRRGKPGRKEENSIKSNENQNDEKKQ
ncbi:MAG: DUF4349 domain-containing protein [Ruminiclostridium sp.]|nr:DUF4349 domain-containing protein [Ruminiclostridium sp.]